MGTYRIYCLTANGLNSFADEIAADSDAEAIAKARKIKRHALKCEVWEDRRLVASLGAQDFAD